MDMEKPNIISLELDPGNVTNIALPRVSLVGASSYLDTDPTPIQWLVPGLLPLGVAALLASEGGLGKSYLTLQLCIALATGKAFLDFEMPDGPRGSVYFGLEDGRDVLHRRIRAIVQLYREIGDWTPEDDANLRANFVTAFVNWSSEGATSHLPELMPNLNLLLDLFQQRKIKPGIVGLDTLARFSDGDENTVQGLRPVLNACAQLSDRGWTPLMLHHVGKGQDGARVKEKPTLAERMSTEWIRGSSSIRDNFRCTIQLAKIREDEADPAGLDPEACRMGQVLVFGTTKFNSGGRADWKVIQQDDHGRWAAMQNSEEALARLRGKKALAALTKQDAILADLYQASRWGGTPDMTALAEKHFTDAKYTNKKNSLKQAISKLRAAGFLQKSGYLPTAQGLDRIKVTGRDKDEE